MYRIILNHYARTPDRPSKKAGQAGGSGPLMSDEFVFALDRTPHLVIEIESKDVDMKKDQDKDGQTT